MQFDHATLKCLIIHTVRMTSHISVLGDEVVYLTHDTWVAPFWLLVRASSDQSVWRNGEANGYVECEDGVTSKRFK